MAVRRRGDGETPAAKPIGGLSLVLAVFVVGCTEHRPPLGTLNFTFEDRRPEDQVALLDRADFNALSMYWPGNDVLPAYLEAAGRVRGRVSIAAVLSLVPATDAPDWTTFDRTIESLQGTGVALWLLLGGAKSAPDAVAPRIREVAAKAAAGGVRVVLYPHYQMALETAEEALAALETAGTPSVSLSLHLCHELKAGNGARLREVIARTASRAELVTINGADNDVSAEGWDAAIQQLGQGDFDVRGRYLEPLRETGYSGPFLLHTFRVKGPPEEHLRASMEAWRAMTRGW